MGEASPSTAQNRWQPRPLGPMAMRPMSEVCAGVTQTQLAAFLTMLPGISLIVLGISMVVEPGVLLRLVAAASVLLGIVLLMVGSFISNLGRQSRM